MAVQRERLALPETCPSDLCALIAACWAERADDRPPFSEVVRSIRAMRGQLDASVSRLQEDPQLSSLYRTV